MSSTSARNRPAPAFQSRPDLPIAVVVGAGSLGAAMCYPGVG